MKIIINTTTLSGTGVTQVAVSFINECIDFPENYYHVFLSKTVARELHINQFPNNFCFYYFDSHPLYGIKGFAIRKQLHEMENKINPDIVFTVFGPACWTPTSKHVCGFANSYYVYPDSPFFDVISKIDYLRINIMKFAHKFFLKRNGKYFICETEDMTERLHKYLEISRSEVFTVSNTYNNYFVNFKLLDNKSILPPRTNNEFRFITLASFEVHKNLTILNKVIPTLISKYPELNVRFVLTIDHQMYENAFSIDAKSRIINLGRVDVKKCPQLYHECDALFLPTLIESFSANYPEAMIMERPILTSNYSFAKSICRDAAMYFDPRNPEAVVETIVEIVQNIELRRNLVLKGKKRVLDFGDAKTRASRYLEVLKIIHFNKIR
ncbi:glycosyltransferase [Paenimyroides aestuarii]|uniref:Glycosyltransferase n=1 Tax=Paenimyroides aestuarii TaxID=2968490 RepID=A0ABY5NRS4_9FLAO|nr:glycosyltransferase [Paenimyroides aestuarii]UUV21271.1 glycosyltransferase [Paenimyroides aestuarii]